jgi:ankyrin repeat protein
MNKLRTILLDALILFAVSTVFVALADRAFSGLKGKIPKDDPVVTAIGQGDLKGLENVIAELEQNPKLSVATQTDEHGRTALMRAAYANLADPDKLKDADTKRVAMAALLLTKGARLDAVDHDGWTALMWAAWSGLPQVAGQLLNSGANHAPADHQGNTALILAAQRGEAEIVKALLAKGADKSATNKAGQNALAAAETGRRQHASSPEKYAAVIAALGELQ